MNKKGAVPFFRVKRPMLACGADMKGAFAIAKGDTVFLKDGFGDLGELDNFTRYEAAINSCTKRLGIKPKIIACDLHPGYFSTRFAENYTLSAKRYTLCKIQHHEAHIVSAIVDNGIKGTVIGAAFDGTGFGTDGNIWGGEFLAGSLKGFERAAHLKYIPMPGTEAAVREPWRMAASHLYRVFGDKFLKLEIDFVKKLDKKKWTVIKAMIDKKLNSPLTSSAGRLFDAVGSLIFAKGTVRAEAELPIALEKAASILCTDRYHFDIIKKKQPFEIDVSKTIKGVVGDLSRELGAPIISAKFHNTVAAIIADTSLVLSRNFKTKKIVLSGGVFQNGYLTKRVSSMLKERGLEVYTHSRFETNDSAIPMGQLAIAAMRHICA